MYSVYTILYTYAMPKQNIYDKLHETHKACVSHHDRILIELTGVSVDLFPFSTSFYQLRRWCSIPSVNNYLPIIKRDGETEREEGGREREMERVKNNINT